MATALCNLHFEVGVNFVDFDVDSDSEKMRHITYSLDFINLSLTVL